MEQRQEQVQRPPAEDTSVPSQHEQQQKFKVFFARLGTEAKEIEVSQGDTVEDVAKAERVLKMEIRVNKENVPLRTPLKEGDIIVAVPESIVGGSK